MSAELAEPYPHPDRSVDTRTPPQDLAAEQCVLGAMLLSKDAIADVAEIIKGVDFYRPAHEIVYDAITDLYSRGEPADAITVAAELTKRGEMARIGGAPYLHTLVASVPMAANGGYYAHIVREKSILRRLVEAGTKIVQISYAGEGQVDDVVDQAQAEIYQVTERRTGEDYAPVGSVLEATLNEIEAIAGRGDELVGVPTGFTDLDELTNGLHPGQLVIVAGRPAMGKSVLGLDLARSASIRHGLTSVVFSLEMSRTEISMRLLSAEAKIPLHHMRNGSMTEEDWAKLSRTVGPVGEAPLFIDDSPNLTMMEIRAKARRLRQRHDLQLVVLDYLQLMSSGKKVESRQIEVSEFSRSLKLLAKELEIPVVVLSQLNRGTEQRADKRPLLSDLRESGCLTASTRVLRADTGAETTMGELFASGAREVPLWALDDQLRYVARPMTHVFSTGVKPVYRLTTTAGRMLHATSNHPLLALDGWTPLGELTAGSRIAIPRSVPAPALAPSVTMTDEQVILLALLIGDGSYLAGGTVRYATIDEANVEAVTAAAETMGVAVRRDEHPAARCTTLRLVRPGTGRWRPHPVAKWLDDLGVRGQRSHEKHIPDPVFHAPKGQIRLFLHHLWATDGSITVRTDGTGGRVYYASTSRRLCDDIARLLLRFGIIARIRLQTRKKGSDYRQGYAVDLSGDDARKFLRQVGSHGARGEIGHRLLAILDTQISNPNADTVPREVWRRVRARLAELPMTHRQFAASMGTKSCASTMWKHSPSRARLARVAKVLDDADLELLATNDVHWDTVAAIEYVGEEEVYDATVVGAHNFIADGVAVHNSIEQDCDVAILLHREDAYERESSRPGEADFIVAKHRNGPTATVTVAFQGHYARFVDMAQEVGS